MRQPVPCQTGEEIEGLSKEVPVQVKAPRKSMQSGVHPRKNFCEQVLEAELLKLRDEGSLSVEQINTLSACLAFYIFIRDPRPRKLARQKGKDLATFLYTHTFAEVPSKLSIIGVYHYFTENSYRIVRMKL